MTPPRLTVTPEQAQTIADVARDRLTRLCPDGLILYDIDDERSQPEGTTVPVPSRWTPRISGSAT